MDKMDPMDGMDRVDGGISRHFPSIVSMPSMPSIVWRGSAARAMRPGAVASFPRLPHGSLKLHGFGGVWYDNGGWGG